MLGSGRLQPDAVLYKPAGHLLSVSAGLDQISNTDTESKFYFSSLSCDMGADCLLSGLFLQRTVNELVIASN